MRSMIQHGLLSLALACPALAFAQEAAAPAEPAAATEASAAAEATPATAAAPAEAAAAPAADTAKAAVATVATAPTAAKGALAPPPEGKGQIVFFREKKFTGGAMSFKVREGQTELGKLSNGSYFVLPVEPGAHQYVVHSEAKDVLNLEVEAGETYYVSSAISMGFMAGHPNLTPSDEKAFLALAPKLGRTQPLVK